MRPWKSERAGHVQRFEDRHLWFSDDACAAEELAHSRGTSEECIERVCVRPLVNHDQVLAVGDDPVSYLTQALAIGRDVLGHLCVGPHPLGGLADIRNRTSSNDDDAHSNPPSSRSGVHSSWSGLRDTLGSPEFR
jgi:hypothetical protein